MNIPVIRKPVSNASIIKAILEQNEVQAMKDKASELHKQNEMKAQESFTEMVYSKAAERDGMLNRYNSFAETVKCSLLHDFLYSVMEASVDSSLLNENFNKTIIRSMVNTYINENGSGEILFAMRNKSRFLSEAAICINAHHKKIIEGVDKTNPDDFCINIEDRDSFFKDLEENDVHAVADSIRQRVADAMEEFVQSNNDDREQIKDILTAAKEKTETIDPDKDVNGVRESYEHLAKQKINNLRSRKKGVLHSMISTMCESVMKNKELQNEFFIEGHLDMDKIVNRMNVMYSFMEMLNTTKLERIDEAYIADVIKDLGM